MTGSEQCKLDIDRGGLLAKVLIQAAFLLLLLFLFLFLPAGRLDWFIGWAVLILFVMGNSGAMLVLIWVDPGLVKERLEVPGEIHKWDRILTSIPKLLLFFVMLPLAGLNDRFGWSGPFPGWLQWAGLIVYALAGIFSCWAMLANRFFAGAVRIQTDRGHTVVSNGPYRWVRHPGYAGWILQFVTSPLALGCWWAVIPGILAAVCYVVRTALEDQTLQKELTGYATYTQKVRSRLLPGIW